MSRRTKILLPTTVNLLKPKLCINVDKKLFACKQRQAHYYNKGVKDLEECKLGNVVRLFPIGSAAKEPVRAIVQSNGDIRAYELCTENGRLDVPNHCHLRKSQEPLYRSFPVMSFKGMATPTRDDVNISLNLKEQHVKEHKTVFPATASEKKPATNQPAPDRRVEPQSSDKQTASHPIQTTGSGRVVKSPARKTTCNLADQPLSIQTIQTFVLVSYNAGVGWTELLLLFSFNIYCYLLLFC